MERWVISADRPVDLPRLAENRPIVGVTVRHCRTSTMRHDPEHRWTRGSTLGVSVLPGAPPVLIVSETT